MKKYNNKLMRASLLSLTFFLFVSAELHGQSVPAAPVLDSATNIAASSFVINWAAVSGAVNYRLDISTDSVFTTFVYGYQNLIMSGTESRYVYPLAINTHYYYRVRAVNTAGTSPNSSTGDAWTLPAPPVAFPATDITSTSFTANWSSIPDAIEYRIDVSTYPDFAIPVGDYENYDAGTDTTLSITGLTEKVTYYYRVRVINSIGTSPNSNRIEAMDLDQNYIRTIGVLVSGKTTPTHVEDATLTERTTKYDFFDGHGRHKQSVVQQGSPSENDIIQPMAYDAFGRAIKNFLPYTDESNGWYKQNALKEPSTTATDKQDIYRSGKQYAFYQAGGLIATDDYPYAETRLELSELNRAIKQGAPGAAWQPDSIDSYTSVDHTIKLTSGFNGASEVLQWTYTKPSAAAVSLFGLVNAGTAASPVYYAASQLSKNKTKDEQGNQVIEYTDKEGRTVLKRVQAASDTTINNTNYASTYYIYDDFGNLVCVIPPEATSKLVTEYFHAAATNATKQSFLKRWAFRYRYDGRRRMIQKQVPGAGQVYLVYDKRNRLVMTQDSVQRLSKYWTFTKYDRLNRPVMTGILTADSTLTQPKMRRRVDYYYANLATNSGAWYESAGSIHGYNNKSYPLESNALNYLTVTYYDDYTFRSSWHGTYTYVDDSLSATQNSINYDQPDTENIRVAGQVTGTKVKVLDSGVTGGYNFLKTVTYYDDKYRAIQSISDNYKGGTDRVTNVYDFAGKLLKAKTTQTDYDIAWKDLGGAREFGNRIYRTAGGGSAWNVSGAVSRQQLPASTDGWVEVVASESSQRMFGLADTNPDLGYTNIDYAFYLNNSQLRIYENGVVKITVSGNTASGDVLRIERSGTTVKYYRNNLLLYTSGAASSAALMVDISFFDNASTLVGMRASFGGVPHTIIRRFEYDHAGHLLKTFHKLDSESEVLLTQNEYNALGQLVDKKLHSVSSSAPKQSVDFRYNIRGWLTSLNDAALTQDGSDAKDLFGMNLDYNTTTSGLGNSAMYNGNISGITWSRNLGLADVKQDGYAYSYDPMNRITAAAFKEKDSSWDPATNSGFSESGYTYDLNGNIKSLLRYDQRGSTTVMDNLTYDYGSSTTQSNRLLKVTDAGDDEAGFKEINGGGDDYLYDGNGNLLWDKNKGGKEILANPSFDSGSSGWVVGDASSRLSFSAGSMHVAYSPTSALIRQNGILIPNQNLYYLLVLDVERTNGTANLIINVGGETFNTNANGRNVFTVMATSQADFVLTIPGSQVWAGKIHSIELKGLMVIKYNHLNLPSTVQKAGEGSLYYIYDATGRKHFQALHEPLGFIKKSSSYAGEYFYENDSLKFVNTEEGRIVMTGATPEYQYHLKDHLGNVRLTFTTKEEVDENKATLETANVTAEQGKFLRYANARRVQSVLFDHTNNPSSTGYAQRLSGLGNEVYGLARSISVMPGDTVNMEVWAKYIDPDTTNHINSTFTNLILQIAAGTAPGGTVVDGGGYAGSTSSFEFGDESATNNGGSTGSGPKAYLNWLVFDRNYVLIPSKSAYRRMTDIAKEQGQNVDHERLQGSIAIDEPGYVYIYVSNEEGSNPYEVYFDDMKVEQIKSPVVQVDDYYPFGLTFNSYQRENSNKNRWKFQGQEHIDDLDLGWDSFKWRNHQPDIGRFFNIDPLADKYVYNSPYAFAENRVIDGRELEGLEWVNAKGEKIYDPKANDGKGGYTEQATSNDKRLGNSLQGTETGQKQFNTLVNSNHPIKTEINLGEEPVYSKEGNLLLGKTDNDATKNGTLKGGKMIVESVTVNESTVTINVSSIEKIINEGGTFSGQDLKGLSFDQVLGAVFGHEINHTTEKSATLDAQKKDSEIPAHEVSKQIIEESKKKNEEKDKQ